MKPHITGLTTCIEALENTSRIWIEERTCEIRRHDVKAVDQTVFNIFMFVAAKSFELKLNADTGVLSLTTKCQDTLREAGIVSLCLFTHIKALHGYIRS